MPQPAIRIFGAISQEIRLQMNRTSASLAAVPTASPRTVGGRRLKCTRFGMSRSVCLGLKSGSFRGSLGTGKPMVLILFSGRPLTLPWAFEHVPAVLAGWFPGFGTGPAVARTRFGESNPSGKLVVSWPRSVGQEPLYYNSLNTGRPANEVDLTRPPADTVSKFVSRYIDEQNSPQFSFGYGLSYTSFRYGATETSAKQLKAAALHAALRDGKGGKHEALTVTAPVTNSGQRAGEEVVQLYIR